VSDFSAEMDLAQRAARRAGEAILSFWREAQSFEYKADDKGLVTRADRSAEHAILELLQRDSPHPVVSEESAPRKRPDALCWVVDPLDGTSNFARRLPFFSTTLALVEGAQIHIAVTYDPLRDLLYRARRGGGAFLGDERLVVSGIRDGRAGILFLNHGYGASDRSRFARLTRLLSGVYDIRKLGSTALELCHIAAGSAEAFLCSGDELWDFAAGLLLVSEAGGRVSDWHGRPWDQDTSRLFVSNGRVHEDILDRLRGTDLLSPEEEV